MVYDSFVVKLAKLFFVSKYLSEDMTMPEVVMPQVKKEKEHKNL